MIFAQHWSYGWHPAKREYDNRRSQLAGYDPYIRRAVKKAFSEILSPDILYTQYDE